jgi:hypothetical protein
MKGRLVAFAGVFCIALLVVSGAYAGKPDQKGKPPRPGNIAEECIVFTGDYLEGGQVVVGCCPNAGPAPAYTMTVDLDVAGIHDVARAGYLFAKPVTTRVKGQKTVRYKIQFFTWDWDARLPGDGDYFFEIYCDGDDIDETNGVLTVTVEEETAKVWVFYNVKQACYPSYPFCDDPSPCENDMIPACDPSTNPTCYHPCNEDFDEDVSFVMTKTTDLSNCPGVN